MEALLGSLRTVGSNIWWSALARVERGILVPFCSTASYPKAGWGRRRVWKYGRVRGISPWLCEEAPSKAPNF